MLHNDIQPTTAGTPGRILVIGDVHGDLQRFLHCLYSCRIFNEHLEWIAEPRNTIVVQLGDQVDSMHRTPSKETEWEQLCDVEMIHMTDRLDRIARIGGGRVLSLLGNHELMNVEGDFTYVSEHSKSKLPLTRRHHMFRPGGCIAQILARRNLILKIGSHLFCHAGILPHHLAHAPQGLHQINEAVRKYLRGLPLTAEDFTIMREVVMNPQSVVWTRSYVELANDPKLNDAIEEVLRMTECRHIYTGHNTVPTIAHLANGKVFLVDAGLSRAYDSTKLHCMQILHPDTPNETIQTIEIK